jgi:hypothetical protein
MGQFLQVSHLDTVHSVHSVHRYTGDSVPVSLKGVGTK